MAFKRHTPGCSCCGVALGWKFDIGILPQRLMRVYATNTDPAKPGVLAYSGTLDLESLAEFGVGSRAVGVDTERKRVLVQRANGEVWWLKVAYPYERGLLWASTTNAGSQKWQLIKYHHSWGYAGGVAGPGPRDPGGWRAAIDGDGSYVFAPLPFGPAAGLETCTDTSGNLYYSGGQTSTFTEIRTYIAKNGPNHFWFHSVYSPFPTVGAGVTRVGALLFYDGTRVHCSGITTPGPGTQGLYYLSEGASSNGNKLFNVRGGYALYDGIRNTFDTWYNGDNGDWRTLNPSGTINRRLLFAALEGEEADILVFR